jgi:cytochrome c
MKKILLIFVSFMFLPGLALAGGDGEAIFKSQGCTSCHRPDKSTKVNPSLADIAQSYQDKTDQLIYYLNGEADAIVKPEKAAMMKRYVERTKNLTDSERKALADYIMSHGR